MIRNNHPVLKVGEILFSRQPLSLIKGLVSAYVVYPIAERHEGRKIRQKLQELRRHYALPVEKRMEIARGKLAESLLFAQQNVPYYRDLFTQIGFDPEKVRKDIEYLLDIPYLDKEIIREQGDRLLSRPLAEMRHHACKTGGSTGLSCIIYYDQPAADYSAAVTLYARERVGNKKFRSELHFACKFPDDALTEWPTREDFKCFAMNRSNIFFDRLDDVGLDAVWRTLQRRRPYMVHAHPSTLYALACYVERKYGKAKAFEIFESSGELLQPYMRDTIAKALKCRVVDRYGLAELGVMAYELDQSHPALQVFESEGWPESRETAPGVSELVFTSFRNRLMPLIRYATGDQSRVEQRQSGFVMADVVGRIHDMVLINGVQYPTHHVQDMLDHRVGGIQEFQIDLRSFPPILRIVPEPYADTGIITAKIDQYWPNAFAIEFVGHDAFVRVGHRAKFRHVVTA